MLFVEYMKNIEKPGGGDVVEFHPAFLCTSLESLLLHEYIKSILYAQSFKNHLAQEDSQEFC